MYLLTFWAYLFTLIIWRITGLGELSSSKVYYMLVWPLHLGGHGPSILHRFLGSQLVAILVFTESTTWLTKLQGCFSIGTDLFDINLFCPEIDV